MTCFVTRWEHGAPGALACVAPGGPNGCSRRSTATRSAKRCGLLMRHASDPVPMLAFPLPQVAWRAQPLARLAPGFQRQVFLARHRDPQCALCALLMDRREGDRSVEAEHRALWPRATRPAPALEARADAGAAAARSES